MCFANEMYRRGKDNLVAMLPLHGDASLPQIPMPLFTLDEVEEVVEDNTSQALLEHLWSNPSYKKCSC